MPTFKSHELDTAHINYNPETLAIRTGCLPTEHGSHGEPIFTTSSFVFESAEQAAARFAGDEVGNIYSRFTNPTVSALQTRLAALEGGEACIATASGMSAIMALCLSKLKAGDTLVSSRSIFGTTFSFFSQWLPKWGIRNVMVDLSDLDAWQKAISAHKPKLIFVETPSNPHSFSVDLVALADIAHRFGSELVVDNCFCTPALMKPLTLGADWIIHSATKFLDGQGRVLGGAVIGKEESIKDVFGFLRTCGPTMSPFNAWVVLKGLETLHIRMKQQSQSAMLIAEALAEHPAIQAVYYGGLPNHPHHELCQQQQQGFGAVLAFEIKGDRQQAWQVINQVKLFSITANLGDTKSTITHPATTTHNKLPPDEKMSAKISEGLIRVSIGLESTQDLIDDLTAAMPK